MLKKVLQIGNNSDKVFKIVRQKRKQIENIKRATKFLWNG